MTREQAIRTIDRAIFSHENGWTASFEATNLISPIGLNDEITNGRCKAIAAWLREIADALDGGPTDAK